MSQRRIVKTVSTQTGPEGRRFYIGRAEVWTGSSETGGFDGILTSGTNKKKVTRELNGWVRERLK